MKSETKNCQNCKQNFVIEPDDFSFYEKIGVPAPIFCPECRLIRRLLWRNERNLYKGICKLCNKNMVSVYAPESPYVVYCPDCWKSDKWDPMIYGKEYDFSKPFFTQFRELQREVPRSALHQTNVIDSPYVNYAEDVRNIYLSYSVIFDCENVYYSRLINNSKNIFDCCDLSFSEICYENISGEKNYNTHFAVFSRNAIDSTFIYDCVNVSNCFLSVNLRNQKYCYKNKPYSKEEYFKILDSYNLNTSEGLERAKKEFSELYIKAVHRFAHNINTVSCTGDNLHNCRNVKHSFNVSGVDNSKYLFRVEPGTADSMDACHISQGEQIYEYVNGGARGSQKIKFCINLKPGNNNVEYSDYCGAVSDTFGSVGVRDKQYVILNKKYDKQTYESIIAKIKKHMNDMPYVDERGIIYKYGEFFPSDFSPFAYNESLAHEYFPKSKTEINSAGFRYRERETRQSIEITTSDILPCDNKGREETLCTTVFRILPEEYLFYKKINLPIPTKCPNCRYFERTQYVNPLKLWHRTCMCNKAHPHHDGPCEVNFETSYAPERPEIIYCEKCYNAEVY